MYYSNPNLINLERIVYQNNRKDYLRLDLNENPGGLGEDFIQNVLAEINQNFISQYPETQEFIDCLVDHIGAKEENICIVNGSSEGIRHIIEAYTAEGGKIVGVTPSYVMYEVYAKMYGRQYISIPYEDNLSIRADKIVSYLNPDIQLLVLLNPNNPIGNAYSEEEFLMIMETAKKYEISVMIDEAYYYFYDHTFIKYALENEHVLLTRTFSKLFSLGGLRLGYVVGHPETVKLISKLCTPHNTNAVAMLFARKVLQTPGMVDKLVKIQLDGKNYIVNELRKEGYEVNVKEGNFIFIKPRFVDADEIVERMKKEKRILVKSYSGIGQMGKCIRMTTGGKEYMIRFVEALLEIDKMTE